MCIGVGAQIYRQENLIREISVKIEVCTGYPGNIPQRERLTGPGREAAGIYRMCYKGEDCENELGRACRNLPTS